jgi:hypothetical protein
VASCVDSGAEPKYSALLILAARASSKEAKALMLLVASIVKMSWRHYSSPFQPKPEDVRADNRLLTIGS